MSIQKAQFAQGIESNNAFICNQTYYNAVMYQKVLHECEDNYSATSTLSALQATLLAEFLASFFLE